MRIACGENAALDASARIAWKTIPALDLDPDIALFNIPTPYPGTQLFDWARKNGYLTLQRYGLL